MRVAKAPPSRPRMGDPENQRQSQRRLPGAEALSLMRLRRPEGLRPPKRFRLQTAVGFASACRRRVGRPAPRPKRFRLQLRSACAKLRSFRLQTPVGSRSSDDSHAPTSSTGRALTLRKVAARVKPDDEKVAKVFAASCCARRCRLFRLQISRMQSHLRGFAGGWLRLRCGIPGFRFLVLGVVVIYVCFAIRALRWMRFCRWLGPSRVLERVWRDADGIHVHVSAGARGRTDSSRADRAEGFAVDARDVWRVRAGADFGRGGDAGARGLRAADAAARFSSRRAHLSRRPERRS